MDKQKLILTGGLARLVNQTDLLLGLRQKLLVGMFRDLKSPRLMSVGHYKLLECPVCHNGQPKPVTVCWGLFLKVLRDLGFSSLLDQKKLLKDGRSVFRSLLKAPNQIKPVLYLLVKSPNFDFCWANK